MFRFFKKHPEYQREFGAFKDMPVEELPKNKRFQAHCASVVNALNNVVDSINDFELLEASLVSLGERHKHRGQTKQQFDVGSYYSISLFIHSFIFFIKLN